jgi:hypothetical protein
MKSLKEYVIEVSKEKGWDYDSKEELFETFEDGLRVETVQISEPDRHRWYTYYDHTVKVVIDGVDRYFQYQVMDVHGESASREDCGYEIPDLDDLVEVFPKQVTTTIYVTKDNL